ncbi:MAG: hypothetical protein LH629_09605 [Ignavibacteria bacterium]|nr:hypothetical protein [Ignavibacteria bacterium]
MNKEQQQEKEDHESLVAVFATGNEAIVAVVKSVLDEAEIRYMAQGDGVQDLFGVGVLGTGFNPITGPVIFKVMPEDENYAKELLKDIIES